MKTGRLVLGALAVVIAGGAMTTEPRGMQGHESEFQAETNIPCPGEYSHGFGFVTGSLLLLQYDYKLTVRPNGELVVHSRTPSIADWMRCIGYSH